jgi:ABC-type proline/glycine betaine transport system substrate-binding protein
MEVDGRKAGQEAAKSRIGIERSYKANNTEAAQFLPRMQQKREQNNELTRAEKGGIRNGGERRSKERV